MKLRLVFELDFKKWARRISTSVFNGKKDRETNIFFNENDRLHSFYTYTKSVQIDKRIELVFVYGKVGYYLWRMVYND